MYDICFYFFMFFTFSIIGWISECISCSIHEKKFIHDRGFLLGPYCPVYGWGALYMYIFLVPFDKNPVIVFLMALIGTSILEYFTSYFMEKMFKARWWDYSDRKFNIAGRICLKNALTFGICGTLFIYIAKPFYVDLISKIPSNIFIIISIILFIIFIVDNIISFTIMNKIKLKLNNVKKDSTSDIDKQVKEILISYKFYIRKLFRSFPTVKFDIPSNEVIIKVLKNGLKNYDELKKSKKYRKKR